MWSFLPSGSFGMVYHLFWVWSNPLSIWKLFLSFIFLNQHLGWSWWLHFWKTSERVGPKWTWRTADSGSKIINEYWIHDSFPNWPRQQQHQLPSPGINWQLYQVQCYDKIQFLPSSCCNILWSSILDFIIYNIILQSSAQSPSKLLFAKYTQATT